MNKFELKTIIIALGIFFMLLSAFLVKSGIIIETKNNDKTDTSKRNLIIGFLLISSIGMSLSLTS